MNERRALVFGAVLALLVVCCFSALALVGGGAYYLRQLLIVDGGPPTGTPQVIRPTETTTATPEVGGPLPGTLPQGALTETLETLENTIVPVNDPVDLARRLLGVEDIPPTLEPPTAPFQVGAREEFWVTNTSTNRAFQVDATLQYVTEHLYFWIEDGVRFDEDALSDLAETFEEKIYPTNREFFGSEWSPGIDGDPHLYILYVRGVGASTAGYFSSADEVHPLAHEYSNGHEMFIINADNTFLDQQYTYGVLAHEFQHMIHWYRDRNEASWVNEGFSEVASFLNGFGPGGFDFYYTLDTDLQLTDWPNDPSATGPHYGASFLFLTYFLDRLGEEATRALVGHDENGLGSVDEVLAELEVTDPLSGLPITADDLVIDWAITNYLLDEDVGDGRYTYHIYRDAPQAYETETVEDCTPGDQTRDVRQYGADYIRITCSGQYTLRFEGSLQTTLLPANPHSGDYAFWSNKGDESDMTLTQTFDFSDHSGPLTLTYWTWYDIETDYDYLYLEASTDGQDWEILTTPSGTAEDPSGNSYGWAYNDLSGGGPMWIQESVDLSQFAGEEVQIRFEYITDAAVNGEGFLLDDVEIAEIGYSTDFEEDEGGWQAAGFVRVQNVLPQSFRLALIYLGDEKRVEYISLDEENTAEISVEVGGEGNEVVLVVVGTTRFTRQPAAYRFDFIP